MIHMPVGIPQWDVGRYVHLEEGGEGARPQKIVVSFLIHHRHKRVELALHMNTHHRTHIHFYTVDYDSNYSANRWLECAHRLCSNGATEVFDLPSLS